MCEPSVDLLLFGIPIMVKSVPLACKNKESHDQEGFKTDSDMASPAEQLMQLSGSEEEDESITLVQKEDNGKKEDICINGAESECGLITSERIREDDDDDDHKGIRAKKRRYRSIDSIYMATNPVDDFNHRKKVKC